MHFLTVTKYFGFVTTKMLFIFRDFTFFRIVRFFIFVVLVVKMWIVFPFRGDFGIGYQGVGSDEGFLYFEFWDHHQIVKNFGWVKFV